MKFTEFKFKDYIQEALRDLNFVESDSSPRKADSCGIVRSRFGRGVQDRLW